MLATGDVYGGRILVAADLGQTGVTSTDLRWRGTFAGLDNFITRPLVDNAFSQAIYT
jgi:hypothetical protein